jgi:hypothetical protein
MADLLSEMVVVSAPDIAMGGRLSLLRLFKEERLLVKALFQDGFYTLVRVGPDG